MIKLDTCHVLGREVMLTSLGGGCKNAFFYNGERLIRRECLIW